MYVDIPKGRVIIGKPATGNLIHPAQHEVDWWQRRIAEISPSTVLRNMPLQLEPYLDGE